VGKTTRLRRFRMILGSGSSKQIHITSIR
jgi:hypothetical protein